MDGGGGWVPADVECGRPPANGAVVRLCRTASAAGEWPPLPAVGGRSAMVVTRTFSDGRTDGRTDGRSDDGCGGVRDLDAL
jgi:hypothetical protein